MAVTIEKAQEMLDAWLAAELALATSGQEYEIWLGGTRRRLTRVNSEEIRKNILFWQAKVDALTVVGKKSRISYIAPRG